MNKLGFGFLRLPKIEGSEDFDFERVNSLVDCFMDNGGKYFDTCYTYLKGESERGIRKCVVERKDRSSFILADKLPGYKCKTYEDAEMYFNEELERCGVDYFDVFMLHWLNQKNYDTAERLDQFGFISKKKAEGKAKRIGFSYHDSASLLDEILTKHPEVDVVQLQINYIDWESSGIEGRKCYEVCVKHNKKVIVMEPVKGGTLSKLPESAEMLLKEHNREMTPSDWALRFASSFDNIETVLSGMNDISQVEANIRDFEPFTDKEFEVLKTVKAIIEADTAISCTACRYCEAHCPMNIAIPDYFRMYNELSRYPSEDWKIKPSYVQLCKTRGKASDCIECRACEANCPQKLKIADYMKNVAEKLEN